MKRTAEPPIPGRRRSGVVGPTLVLLVLVALGAGLAWQRGLIGPAGVSAEDVERVVLVAAAPDEDGAVVAQVIAVADITQTPATIEALDPSEPVVILGTSYDRLADAYAFGGGEGVAEAATTAFGGERLPYVALDAATLARAVDEAGGVRLRLPAPMSVFDGERLFTLREGVQDLDAAGLGAAFKGAPYLNERQGSALDAALADMLADVISGMDHADVATDLSPEAFERLVRALATR